jgi:hypothetical protein
MNLETNTDISIDEEGQWWNAGERLIHEGVLFYFKSNLYRSASGRYFIYSESGNRAETGWLHSVRGFPVFADRAIVEPEKAVVHLILETGLILNRSPDGLYVGGADLIWIELFPSEQHPSRGDRPIPVRLRSIAMSALAPYLEEDGEHWALNLDGKIHRLTWKIPDFSSNPAVESRQNSVG